jgi:hypothetical protein
VQRFRAAILLFALALLALPGGGVRRASAEEVAVPAGLQAELIAKVAPYDKNFAARASDRVHVLVVTRSGDADSERTANQLTAALRDVKDIGGLPHDEATLAFSGAQALADAVRARRASIVYLTPGLTSEIEGIRDALSGISVLSVGAVADYALRGAVLGFDLVSGKPKIVCNLTQAKKQDVAFKAEVLKLMRVIE